MKKNTKGSSMISVIVAFVILMLGMGMVYTSIMFSKNLTAKAVQVRKKAEDTMASYYRGTGTVDPALSKYTDFTLKEKRGKEIKFGGRYTVYTAANGEKVYAFNASPGDGWHAADNILSDYVFDRTTSGEALNSAIIKENNGIFPPVSAEEQAKAQKAIDERFKDLPSPPTVPSGMVWKGNTCKDSSDASTKSYYLWATTDTRTDSNGMKGWNAVLLCIDGRLFVSTDLKANKVAPVGTAGLYSYTKEEIIASFEGKSGIEALDSKFSGKFVEVF